MPAAAPMPALTAPQNAERRPMPVFWWIVMRSDTATARSIFSLDTFMDFAKRTTGIEAVMPWLPEPETITTGSSQPLMRASEPAAA